MKHNKLMVFMFAMLISAAATYIIWDGIESDKALADTRRIKDYEDSRIDDTDYRLMDIESEADAREVITIYADKHNFDEDDYERRESGFWEDYYWWD